MHLFYTPDIAGDAYTLSPDESRHAVGVLRLVAGDRIHLCDGRGGLYTATIEQASAKACCLSITDRQQQYGRRNYGLHIALAPTKNIDRYEWFLEKATEIGVDRLTPLLCDHSERRVVKDARSAGVVTSAVKQSLKAYMPQVDSLTPFAQLIAEGSTGGRFIAHCDADTPRLDLSTAIGEHHESLVLIGPEGDFSPQEVESAHAAGFRSVTLGPSRLRTETAGVMAAAMAAIAAANRIMH